MGAYNYSAGELASQIKKMGKLNIAHLGNTAIDQNMYIFYYMTQAMWKHTRYNFNRRTSEPLTVTEDGYVTFKIDEIDIVDLYDPLRVLTPDEVTGTDFKKRNEFQDPWGWFCESADDQIHIKGAGTYVLQYKAYTDKITTETQVPQWPAACYDLLIYETVGKIKESLNDLEGASIAYSVADKLVPLLSQLRTGTASSVRKVVRW